MAENIERKKVPQLDTVSDINKFTAVGVESPSNKSVKAPVAMILNEVRELGYLTSEEYSPIEYPEI